ncbi:hypothetical protein [Clostridium botulinum]|uniref:hypothetical protein n=1 Tax=Clostridium botulinum TaxID=1491 RepID=UPI001966DAC9|nr:hypothetical protein [Clostridium botulinum]MBN1050311.1 hypothetical protein [Clostridium botulinum]
MKEEIQKLIVEMAEDRIKEGCNKDIMFGNLGLLLTNMQITGEQYKHLTDLLYPATENHTDVDKPINENTEVKEEIK